MTVTNPASGVSVAVQMEVDTHRIYPIIPASILRDIGVEPKVRQVVELVHGTWLTIDQGEIDLTVQGMKVPAQCVFGPERDPASLGWLVLESLSLAVDEENQRLVQVVRRWIEHG